MIENDKEIDILQYIDGIVDDEGGPYSANIGSETDEHEFDTTC